MKCGLLPVCQEACICGPTLLQAINIDAATKRLSLDDSIRDPKVKVSLYKL